MNKKRPLPTIQPMIGEIMSQQGLVPDDLVERAEALGLDISRMTIYDKTSPKSKGIWYDTLATLCVLLDKEPGDLLKLKRG